MTEDRLRHGLASVETQFRLLRESKCIAEAVRCASRSRKLAVGCRNSLQRFISEVRESEERMQELDIRLREEEDACGSLSRCLEAVTDGSHETKLVWDEENRNEGVRSIQDQRCTALLRCAHRIYSLEAELARVRLEREGRTMQDLIGCGSSPLKIQDTPADAWFTELRTLSMAVPTSTAKERKQTHAFENFDGWESGRASQRREKTFVPDAICVSVSQEKRTDDSRAIHFSTLRKGLHVEFTIEANPHGDVYTVNCPLGLDHACSKTKDSISRGYGAQETITSILWPAIERWIGQIGILMDRLGVLES